MSITITAVWNGRGVLLRPIASLDEQSGNVSDQAETQLTDAVFLLFRVRILPLTPVGESESVGEIRHRRSFITGPGRILKSNFHIFQQPVFAIIISQVQPQIRSPVDEGQRRRISGEICREAQVIIPLVRTGLLCHQVTRFMERR